MTTASDIINGALKDVGALAAGETAEPEDTSDALELLNQMLGQWQATGLNVYAQKDVSFAATGATSYTIGTGGVIDTTRPTEVISAFWRSNGQDYDLTVINAFQDYQRIGSKSFAGVPGAIYYQAAYPLGKVYVYPIPASGEVHLTVQESLQTFASAAETVTLPPEYMLALRYSLAEMLKISYPEMQPRFDIEKAAAKARKIIKRNNVQIPFAQLPSVVLGSGATDIMSGY